MKACLFESRPYHLHTSRDGSGGFPADDEADPLNPMDYEDGGNDGEGS